MFNSARFQLSFCRNSNFLQQTDPGRAGHAGKCFIVLRKRGGEHCSLVLEYLKFTFWQAMLTYISLVFIVEVSKISIFQFSIAHNQVVISDGNVPVFSLG